MRNGNSCCGRHPKVITKKAIIRLPFIAIKSKKKKKDVVKEEDGIINRRKKFFESRIYSGQLT